MHHSSHEPDLRLLDRLQQAETVALLAVTGVAAGTLFCWQIASLAALAPAGWSAMRPVTATGILIAVLSLALSALRRSKFATRASIAAGLVLVALPAIVVLTYLGFQPTFPQIWPVRPAPETAIAVGLSALSLPVIRQSRSALAALADASAIFFAAFALLLFAGCVLQGFQFVAVDRSALTTPQTVFCLGLLAFVVASRRAAEGGALSVLVGTGLGSRIARKVLFAIITVPFLLFAGISSLDRFGVMATDLSRAFAAPLVVLATVTVMVWMAHHANGIERQLRQQSLTDQLTGVLNRRGFETVAEYVMRSAERTGTRLVAFFFDLDGLKRANDELGHEAGSLMIQRFADLLVVTFRKSDVVARVGGDEFVVLAPALPESVQDILARLAYVAKESNASGLVPTPLSYSVGVAELPPGHRGQIWELVAEADARMYAEKSRKRAA
jgi:diguanylate cyclase (GGDEF)-like protein